MRSTLENLYRSSLTFLYPLTPKKTYSTIINAARTLVDAEEGSLFLARDKKLIRVYSSVPKLEQVEPRRNGYTYRCFRTRQVYVLTRNILKKTHPEFKTRSIKSFILIPLWYKRTSVGVLSLRSKREIFFVKHRMNILKLFGSMASLAIRKMQLFNEVKKSLETRDLFISMASHELKTPLTTIYGYAQLLEHSLRKKGAPETDWAQTLEREALRLSIMINELLQVDQIKTGKFQYNWKYDSLKNIIKRSVQGFKVSHSKYKLFIEHNIKGSDIIFSDFDKLMQAIINILNNSAKFSSPKDPITLTTSSVKNNLIIKITDRGKGIPKEDLSKVFKGFYKGTHSKQGMGLGLYITNNIIKQHKGTIQIKSKEGVSTTVEIKLPKIKS